ncbi:hypothetical protein [Effusibacillus consociatus]|uniref:Uncharacterized protein n=1 Tax=Effusibacillus consociatus TaxID=1117041 RepID=A0ABV9Q3W3_9BACL
MQENPEKDLQWLEEHKDELKQEIANIKAAVKSTSGDEKRFVPLAVNTEDGISSNYNASLPGTPKSLTGFDTKGMQRLD